jgi:hypothetical protein
MIKWHLSKKPFRTGDKWVFSNGNDRLLSNVGSTATVEYDHNNPPTLNFNNQGAAQTYAREHNIAIA